MSTPINDVRNFKQARSAGNTRPLHHAQANEAQVEVTIETESETLTCEMNTMNNTNNVEQIRPTTDAADITIDDVQTEMNNLASAIKDAIEKPSTTTAEENTMEQTKTISITDVTTRYKTLRRNAIIGSVVGNVATVAGMVAGAHLNDRNVKRAAIIGGGLATVSMAWMATSKLQKSATEFAAENVTEETYQALTTGKTKGHIFGAIGSLAVGALIGAFAIRKAVSSAE